MPQCFGAPQRVACDQPDTFVSEMKRRPGRPATAASPVKFMAENGLGRGKGNHGRNMRQPVTVFGDRLRRWRLDLSRAQGKLLTHEVLEKEAGLARGTWSRYEAGGRHPGLEVQLRLAAVLGVAVEEVRQAVKESREQSRKLRKHGVRLAERQEINDPSRAISQVQVNVYLPVEVERWIRSCARDKDMSLSSFIARPFVTAFSQKKRAESKSPVGPF